MDIKHSTCFWIAPNGRIIPSGITHIAAIIENPKFFGTSSVKIRATYEKHNERMGTEGEARLEIIKKLILKNWIRVRNYKRQGTWTINVPKLTKNIKDYIQAFAQEIINATEDKYSKVYIDTPKSRKWYSMEALAHDILYEEIKMNIKFTKLITEGISNDDINQYLITALWSSNDDDGNPLDDNYGINDCSKKVKSEAKKDLTKFYQKAKSILEDKDSNYDGDWRHDFWLTRNGHGAGFWDDGGEDGDKLSKITDKFGEVSLYVGDDGEIHQN